jgi:transposase InsO family protein
MAQADGRQTYGRLRLLRAVWTRGMRVGDKRVRRLMRAAQLVARGRRRFRITTDSGHASPIVGHPLARQFAVQAPNRVWAADITALSTRDGWCYLAVVLDLYSRRLVGWAADTTLEPGLMLTALHRALMTRGVRPGLLHHSDRGRQYANAVYQRVLAAHTQALVGSHRFLQPGGDCTPQSAIAVRSTTKAIAECRYDSLDPVHEIDPAPPRPRQLLRRLA